MTPHSSCSACYACWAPLCLRRQVRSLCAFRASRALSPCRAPGTILVFDAFCMLCSSRSPPTVHPLPGLRNSTTCHHWTSSNVDCAANLEHGVRPGRWRIWAYSLDEIWEYMLQPICGLQRANLLETNHRSLLPWVEKYVVRDVHAVSAE